MKTTAKKITKSSTLQEDLNTITCLDSKNIDELEKLIFGSIEEADYDNETKENLTKKLQKALGKIPESERVKRRKVNFNPFKKPSMLVQLKEPFECLLNDVKSLFKKVFNFFNVSNHLNKKMSDFLNADFSPLAELEARVHDNEQDIENVKGDAYDEYDIEDVISNYGTATEHYVDGEIEQLKEDLEQTCSTMSEGDMVLEITEQVENAVQGNLNKMFKAVKEAADKIKSPTIKSVELERDYLKLALKLQPCYNSTNMNDLCLSASEQKLIIDAIDYIVRKEAK